MAFVCVAIKLESFGPAFCRQPRLDANGQFFLAFKFRTTFYEQEWTPRPIRGWSARETRVGQFPRHTRIEDLPQLVNVLRGEISLIPRMKVPNLLDFAKWAICVAAAAAFGAVYQGGGAIVGLLTE
jgi:lipopolysaccharide/colanic/teichoic acid biosynthesis glycosyltransferase